MNQAEQVIAGYHVTEQLDISSRTLVYRGLRLCDRQPVILKLLRNEYPSFNELIQFRNQYTIAKNLDLPGVIRTYTLEPHGNSYVLVMEDFGGISLAQFTQKQPLDITTFLAVAIQLADILNGLYQHRVIHKDIKPANILIHPDTKKIKLIDFSISSLLPRETQEIKNPNLLEGTLAYISPEQTGRMNRGIDYRTDFYSFGITCYELLTGKLPFNSDNPIELVYFHLAKTEPKVHQINPNIPTIISQIITKLMAKNAEDRYQSAWGLKHDLETCISRLKETGKIEPFQIGQRDICERFTIPQKLYQRETEVKILLDTFEKAAAGNTEMIMVTGLSGIGKTAVINQVHKPIVRQHGYFIKGKFDGFNRNIPFSAFVQAFRDLISQLLSEPDSKLQSWKTQILNTLGENAQVILEVIPELEKIIGQQPPAPEISGNAAQNRFNSLFSQFVQVFTTKEHPLVIFLDDLQWADYASLNLLKSLITQSEAGYLLLLGAYRDNEVNPSHPLILTLDDIQKRNIKIKTLTLLPLDQTHLNLLVADTLLCSTEIAYILADLVYQKTQGNPFFTTQFLQELYEENCIKFDREVGYWQCDFTQIRQLALTDDVVNFMLRRLKKLSKPTQNVLKLAACLGNQFDLAKLAVICEHTQEEVAINLWQGLQEGFVIPKNETYKFFQEKYIDNPNIENISVNYRFVHDRIQQAAYCLIPETLKPTTHYRISQLLLNNLSQIKQDEMLFDIVNHINLGQSLVQQKNEQEQLAKLNLIAGQKALYSTAYEAAIEYFKTGIKLLKKKAWINQYNLIFSLYLNLAKAQLSHGTYDALQQTIAVALQQVTTPINLADIYTLQTVQYTLQAQYENAIKAGLIGLSKLGIEINSHNLTEQIQQELTFINQHFKKLPISSLLDLPTAVPQSIQKIIKLLMVLETPAYITAKIELYTLFSLKAVHLSIEHGNVPESIKAYANYGLILTLSKGQYQRGYELADLALQLSYKFNSKSQRCQAGLLAGAWIQVWAKPITGAADINYQSFLAGLESGETQFAAYNLFGNIFNRLFQGEKLICIAEDIEKYQLIADKIKDKLLQTALAAAKIFITNLCLEEDTQEYNDLMIDAEKVIADGEASQTELALCLCYILRMHLCCLTANFEQGSYYRMKAESILNSVKGFTTYSGYYYYGSLILLNLYTGLSPKEHDNALQQIKSNQKQLKIWSESCSENFLHKYVLVEAEKCKILGKKAEAIELYDRAIAGAKENGYTQEEALGNELAAKFYLAWNKEIIASSYMIEAYYCYSRWGAKAKVAHLETHYPQ
ncbi:MAG: serine/threonine-protein kinase PknK, partial [Microcoleaceae cyanobacterium]